MTEVVVKVTPEQVRAARLEVAAKRAAGLRPNETIAEIAGLFLSGEGTLSFGGIPDSREDSREISREEVAAGKAAATAHLREDSEPGAGTNAEEVEHEALDEHVVAHHSRPEPHPSDLEQTSVAKLKGRTREEAEGIGRVRGDEAAGGIQRIPEIKADEDAAMKSEM